MIRILSFLVIFFGLSGCNKNLPGTQGPNPTAGGDCERFGAVGVIAINHGHVLNIPTADILKSKPQAYDITGTSGHAHTVNLNVNSFNLLALKQPVNVVSTLGGGHTHNVLIKCK